MYVYSTVQFKLATIYQTLHQLMLYIILKCLRI